MGQGKRCKICQAKSCCKKCGRCKNCRKGRKAPSGSQQLAPFLYPWEAAYTLAASTCVTQFFPVHALPYPAVITPCLAAFASRFGFGRAFVFDLKGNIIASSDGVGINQNDFDTRNYIRLTTQGEAQVTATFGKAAGATPTFIVTSPVYDANRKPMGGVALQVNLSVKNSLSDCVE